MFGGGGGERVHGRGQYRCCRRKYIREWDCNNDRGCREEGHVGVAEVGGTCVPNNKYNNHFRAITSTATTNLETTTATPEMDTEFGEQNRNWEDAMEELHPLVVAGAILGIIGGSLVLLGTAYKCGRR